MNIVKLKENLWAYQFEKDRADNIGLNIYLLKDKDEFLLIDSGHEHHMKQVLEVVDRDKIKCVILSHYHEDHVEGLRLLEGVETMGHPMGRETLKMYLPDEVKRLAPSQTILDGEVLNFGEFSLKFYHHPGHSDCSIMIDIDGEYLHVGDQYLTRNSGVDVLPDVRWRDVGKHIDALDTILKLAPDKILLSHGMIPLESSCYTVGINDRKLYLNALLASNNTCTAEEAVKETSRKFELLHWRDYTK